MIMWTKHFSRRYRDPTHSEGYPYWFNETTGQSTWFDPTTPSLKRRRSEDHADSRCVELMPEEEKERLIQLSDGHIRVKNGQFQYFCDRMKKWAFETNSFGVELLCELVHENQPPLRICEKAIADTRDSELLRREGESIYSEKRNLIGPNGVTWSHEEYGHLGLQLKYLQLKSWQRFTETWALLERAGRQGLFQTHISGSNKGANVRVLSIGGGPGYELLAFRRFFRTFIDGRVPLHLVSLDLQPGWRPYVESMGMRFEEYDITKGGLIETVSDMEFDGVTYVLISYVMIYCTDEKTIALLGQLLSSKDVYCILVSERGEETRAVSMMKQRGFQTLLLIDQTFGKDERQTAWLDPSTPLPTPLTTFPTIFPNQPFDDKKKKRQRK